MTRVLVTGFEPFGAHEVNPSALIAEALEGVVLPVSFARASGELREAIADQDPELVVCFGLADRDPRISVERFAHNLDEADAIDNEGAGGSGSAIVPGGPLALLSSLPVDAIVAALQAEEIPAAVSRDAGGYLCNHIFYVLMGMLAPGRKGGFVHVPGLDVLPLETQIHAARTIVAVASA
jgi:pyroglutamyl-peptidase